MTIGRVLAIVVLILAVLAILGVALPAQAVWIAIALLAVALIAP